MAVTATALDGNNVGFVFNGSVSANAFTLNTATGAVTSAYFPATWTAVLRKNALKLFSVTTLAQRQTVQFLDRLVAIGSIDGTTIATSSAVAGNLATLVVTVNANTTVLVQLPHSIFGAASLGQSVPAAGGGGGGSVVPADLGLVRFTGAVDGAVGLGNLVALNGSGTLVRADKTIALALPCVGAYELDSALNICVRTSGEVAATGGPFTAGATIYVGLAGAATATNPTTPGESRQVVGYATSSGKLFVQPGFVEVI